MTAVLSGAILMSLEMVAFRLYAPYFGYSIYVWGTMICVVMGALVVGYAIGGRLADTARAERLLFGAILTSALWQLVILCTMRFVLSRLAQGGEVAGVTFATLIIFAPSMIALAATGPILVRLCADAGRVGWAAGTVYALSTVGGMAGILVTIFWLLPTIGTEKTMRLFCGFSFLIGSSGFLWMENRARRVLAVALAIVPIPSLLLVPGLGWSEGTVWTAESSYNLVRVVRNGSQWWLQLNRPDAIQTIRDQDVVWTGYYYDRFALGPLLVPAKRALVLGMGAGASIHSMRATAPEIVIDAVEIDPKVVEAAVRWFGIDPADRRLRIHVADARRWLTGNRETYDLVQLDVYQGGPYIPFYLVTEEFFRLARERMNDDALLMMNVFDESKDSELLLALAATMRRVFPSVMVESRGANYMLFAFTRRQSSDSIRQRLSDRIVAAPLRDARISEIVPPPGAQAFTDNLAPVEEITRRMLTAP
jgi:spermidine synthase